MLTKFFAVLNPWVLLVILLLPIAGFVSGYVKGMSDEAVFVEVKSGKAQAQETQRANRETTRRELVSGERETSRERIRIVYRALHDRAAELRATSGVVDSVGSVATCRLDDERVQLWNAANAGDTAPVRGEPDYGLRTTAASAVGQLRRFAGEPHRDNGDPCAVSGSVTQVGAVCERAAGVR